MRLRWIFWVVFALTLCVLIPISLWKPQNTTQFDLPKPGTIQADAEEIKLNSLLYDATKLNNELKNNESWGMSWLASQLEELGLQKVAKNGYMKVGEKVDEKFLVGPTDTDRAACVIYLTLAQKLAPLKTKRSYVFITGGNYRYKESTHVAINCMNDKTSIYAPNIYVGRKIKLMTINQPVKAERRPSRVIITPTKQEDELATILKLCNFSLDIINSYDRGDIP